MRTVTRPRPHNGPGNHNRATHHTDRANQPNPTALERMLTQRNRLAEKLYEAEAHGYAHAVDTAQLLGATEDAIRNLNRRTFRTHVSRWAEHDLQRTHDADNPRPDTCPTCAHEARGTHQVTA